LAEADAYDEIFAALKHPVRRQILLFLEESMVRRLLRRFRTPWALRTRG
jgi:DNA-binding transcriptional ArsR family regulator